MLEVPVRDFSREFDYDELWTKTTSPKIQLNTPPAHASYQSTTALPVGVGTVQGTWTVKDQQNGVRSVTGEADFVAGGLTGKFYLDLNGTAQGSYWVSGAHGDPMTMTYIPGDCAVYAGDVTLSGSTVTSANLSGPSGSIHALLQLAPGSTGTSMFDGVLTLTQA